MPLNISHHKSWHKDLRNPRIKEDEMRHESVSNRRDDDRDRAERLQAMRQRHALNELTTLNGSGSSAPWFARPTLSVIQPEQNTSTASLIRRENTAIYGTRLGNPEKYRRSSDPSVKGPRDSAAAALALDPLADIKRRLELQRRQRGTVRMNPPSSTAESHLNASASSSKRDNVKRDNNERHTRSRSRE